MTEPMWLLWFVGSIGVYELVDNVAVQGAGTVAFAVVMGAGFVVDILLAHRRRR